MRPVTVTVGPLAAAVVDNICLSQTPTAAFTINGALLLNGSGAVLDTARRVLFTPAADESAKTFTIIGTNASGMPQTEVIAGTNATAFYTNLDFKTVTSITISTAAAGAITVGTNGIASSAWVRMDDYAPSLISLQANVSGTVNYTVQTTLDDPNSPTNPVNPYSVTWVNSSDVAVVGVAATAQSNFMFAPIFAKVTLNSGTGSVTTTFLQSSNGPI